MSQLGSVQEVGQRAKDLITVTGVNQVFSMHVDEEDANGILNELCTAAIHECMKTSQSFVSSNGNSADVPA